MHLEGCNGAATRAALNRPPAAGSAPENPGCNSGATSATPEVGVRHVALEIVPPDAEISRISMGSSAAPELTPGNERGLAVRMGGMCLARHGGMHPRQILSLIALVPVVAAGCGAEDSLEEE